MANKKVIIPANIMNVVDIDEKSVNPETVTFVENNLEPTYRDTVLREHLYNVSSFIDEVRNREIPKPTRKIWSDLEALGRALDKAEAGYMRFVN